MAETIQPVATATEQQPLLSCEALRLGYADAAGRRAAVVHGVDFTVERGSTLAIVGESGSGKSTIAKALVRLIPVISGSIRFAGTEISGLSAARFLPWRRKIQLVFQDPWLALNPRATLEEALAEPLRIHFPRLSGSERRQRIQRLLDTVQLPASGLGRYPSGFSGGQRQRILIARALAVEPELLICDEPVSALDVSIQAEILQLLATLKAQRNLTLLFISHDLAVVYQVADEILVMREGQAVEKQARDNLFARPQAEYTRELLDACPKW